MQESCIITTLLVIRLCRDATWIENHAFLSSLALHPLFHNQSRGARATPSVAMNDVRRQAQTCQTAQLLPKTAQSRVIYILQGPPAVTAKYNGGANTSIIQAQYRAPLALLERLNDLGNPDFELHTVTVAGSILKPRGTALRENNQP
jgi:hypothetical protein